MVSIKGVLLLDGRVVLVKNPRDEWELPGGRVDGVEAHAQTLSREFAEELALDIAIERRSTPTCSRSSPVATCSSSPTAAG